MYYPLHILVLVFSIFCIVTPLHGVYAMPAGNRRALSSAVDLINVLNRYAAEVILHAKNLRQLVKQSASRRTAAFEQESATEALGFLNSLRGFQSTLAQLGADKNLSTYNGSAEIEPLGQGVACAITIARSNIDAVVDTVPDIASELNFELTQVADLVADISDVSAAADLILTDPILQDLFSDACDYAEPT